MKTQEEMLDRDCVLQVGRKQLTENFLKDHKEDGFKSFERNPLFNRRVILICLKKNMA